MEETRGARLLRADEIECRVGTAGEKGLSLLLFKDARVDQKILDELFTPFGWKRSHQTIDGNLYCTVEVWDREKGQWIGKQDVGTMSYSEKEKGQASDSFKRACVNWGIGRELYTAPFIWIPAGKAEIRKNGDRYVTGDRFKVQEIRYNSEREICGLKIKNSRGIVVFQMKEGNTADGARQPKAARTEADVKKELEEQNRQAQEEQNKQTLYQELERTGISLETVLARYSLKSLEQMTPETYRNAISGLQKSKNKAA